MVWVEAGEGGTQEHGKGQSPCLLSQPQGLPHPRATRSPHKPPESRVPRPHCEDQKTDASGHQGEFPQLSEPQFLNCKARMRRAPAWQVWGRGT